VPEVLMLVIYSSKGALFPVTYAAKKELVESPDCPIQNGGAE